MPYSRVLFQTTLSDLTKYSIFVRPLRNNRATRITVIISQYLELDQYYKEARSYYQIKNIC